MEPSQRNDQRTIWNALAGGRGTPVWSKILKETGTTKWIMYIVTGVPTADSRRYSRLKNHDGKKMIIKQKSIDKIKPIFKEYLNYMSQFFEIFNHTLWYEGALKNLQRYMVENDRHIYVLIESESIIGFALVNKHLRFNNDGFAIADFYIQKEYKKKGYGRRLAEHVFAQFTGNWEVAVSSKNNSGREFWKHVLSSYTNDKFIEKKKNSFNGYGLIFNNT